MTLIKDLSDPANYPEPMGDIELVQTHISFIFIGQDYVYKVKKPVDFGFLDFTTLEKRKYFCEQEVELNQRLSPDTYLGVIPVTDEGNRLAMGGDGPTVDYAVKMKRIPLDRLMKTLLDKGELTGGMVSSVAAKLAEFHATADNSPEIDEFGRIEISKKNTDENFEQTIKYIGQSISREQYDCIKDFTDCFYESETELFDRRIADKKIRDCHGDLHMEHICLTDPIIIFDCIEFNERFRYSDVAADIAFLAMDLDFHGRGDLAGVLMNAYVGSSEDEEVMLLLDFYKTYRAYVRGKVISFRLDDPNISDDGKKEAMELASRYFALAESYAKRDK